MFPHVLGVALPIDNSDHSPILLKPKPPFTSGRQFKYEAYWEVNDLCREIVADGSHTNLRGETQWDNVCSKLRNCQRKLSIWIQATFKNTAKEISILKGKLQTLLNMPSNEVDWGRLNP